MASCKLTMIGMYNYDSTLFDGLTFPAGINKDTAVNEILMKSGEFEVNYPDPTFMKFAIDHWGKKHYRTFEKWVEALSIDFNPLYNYDRYEEYTDSRAKHERRERENNRDLADVRQHNTLNERNVADTMQSSDIRQHSENGTNEEEKNVMENTNANSSTNTNTTNDVTLTHSVSAYDSNEFQPRDQEITDGETNVSGNGSSVTGHMADEKNEGKTASNSNEVGNASQSANTSENENTKSNDVGNVNENERGTESGRENEVSNHNAHLYGNIGVTTSSALLEEFLRVERFNIYEQIADIFVDEFCIRVYA